jgi:hypothetical protein
MVRTPPIVSGHLQASDLIISSKERTKMEKSAERTDVIEGFGDEWTRFDQTGMTEKERLALFEG